MLDRHHLPDSIGAFARSGLRIVWNLLGRAYQGASDARFLFRRFPVLLFYGNASLVFGISVGGYWFLNERGWALSKIGTGLWLPDPAVLVALSYTLLVAAAGLGSWHVRSRRSNRRFQGLLFASATYFAIAALVCWSYSAWVLNASLPHGDDLSSGSWMTSRIGLLDWGEGGKSSSLLAVQLLLAMLILANGRYERRTKVIRPLALLLVGLLTLVMVVAVLEESHRRPADLLMSSAIAAVFTNLTIGLSFHMGPAGFGRLMADAVSGLILLFIMLFYYSAKPDVLLWRSACYLGLFAIVLLIDSWFDPRGARRPS